jgi:predicted RNA polymerase sigma factor
MRLAKLQLSAGRPAEALASADLAIATATLGPLRAGAHLVRGFAALALDRPVDALGSADAALDPAGEDKQLRGYAFAIRGAALMMQRRVAEGRAAFDEARRLLPDDPNVRQLAQQAGA